MGKLYEVVVTASWTMKIPAESQGTAFEMVAEYLPKLTIEGSDDGLIIEEPTEVVNKETE